MSSLTRFINDGIELVIDTTSGESFATINGYARMSGIAKNTVSNRLARGYKGVHKNNLKTAEIVTEGGLQGVHLISAKVVFAWLIKDNPELAEKMGEVGATVYLHKLAGYEVKSTAVESTHKTPTTYIEALKALVASEEEKERLKQEKELLELENAELVENVEHLSETVDELFNYSSVIRVAKFNNVSEKNFSWHKLKAASKALTVEIKKVPCPRFVSKNLYHHDAWRLAYPDYQLPETTTIRLAS